MSVYTEKIYPDIASAPEDDQQDTSQNYRLKKIEEAEQFLREEIKTRNKLSKKFKRITNGVTIADISALIIFTAVEGTLFATGVGIPFGISLICRPFLCKGLLNTLCFDFPFGCYIVLQNTSLRKYLRKRLQLRSDKNVRKGREIYISNVLNNSNVCKKKSLRRFSAKSGIFWDKRI